MITTEQTAVHGHRTLQGKDAFDGEIENDAAVGSPTLEIDQLIDEGDTVLAVGHGVINVAETGETLFAAPTRDEGA